MIVIVIGMSRISIVVVVVECARLRRALKVRSSIEFEQLSDIAVTYDQDDDDEDDDPHPIEIDRVRIRKTQHTQTHTHTHTYHTCQCTVCVVCNILYWQETDT